MADLDGVAEQIAAIRAIATRVQTVTPQGATRAAHLVEARTKQLLSLTSHPPGTPTPSAPGSPPALISGALRRSITVTDPTRIGDAWTVTVGPTIVYGRIQELGGTAGRGSQLPPRPYLAPGLAAARDEIGDALADVWRDAIR